MNVYENLANAIIVQASKDYRAALKGLIDNPSNSLIESDKEDCEKFFRSRWYQALTTLDGEFLIRKLKEEVENP